jgi:hypothetical protein
MPREDWYVHTCNASVIISAPTEVGFFFFREARCEALKWSGESTVMAMELCQCSARCPSNQPSQTCSEGYIFETGPGGPELED